MSHPRISVIIPLYNKETEIEYTLRSVLAQTLPPLEIIVVNDGSTDESLDVARSVQSPLIRIIDQSNGGVCRARNRGIEQAMGDYIAFLDADDEWEPNFLEEISALIRDYPEAGAYSTAFNVVSNEGSFPADTPTRRGIVENFFRESAHKYIVIPSTCCIRRDVLRDVGLFPEGMKIGEDLYMWIKIARKYKFCFSPELLASYSRIANNRSAKSYTREKTRHTFEELYREATDNDEKEFIARAALGKALILCVKGDTEYARRAIECFGYTRVYRSTLRKVKVLCRLPRFLRPPLMRWYNFLAWKIAKKGL